MEIPTYSYDSESYNQAVLSERDFMLTPEAQKQYDAVVKKYKGTDKWLKAPNGKDTNLSEQQWYGTYT